MTAKTLLASPTNEGMEKTEQVSIGDFFKDQEDTEIEADTSSIDSTRPIKSVRQDSVRMFRQTLPLAKPSAAIIETTPTFPLTPASPHQSKTEHDTHLLTPPLPTMSQSSSSSTDHPPLEKHIARHSPPSTDDPIEAMVQAGIQFHEAGQLEKATECFRQATTKESPMGMFLYGVSLRHGWGCKKSEHLAFQYLQKAAEHAVLDLNNLSNTVNRSASKGELIIAIYEMGVSFRHGWGCKKNKETAVHFFKIAADLGDPDAQNDLGFCYHHGHGVKKDLHMAAKYYRKADKQGHGLLGNSWIWKSKYDLK
ncbi:HCP-like protein [Hesseltinella vesiculosa]|uniref:HCP-like protein n=1 Tax=Hesseltinella vesiculosa TaxID=101127 RepID=A0A1X2GKJ2_9FUNG|nr:HCP-like protein [Hesseltinella vesiculosa]